MNSYTRRLDKLEPNSGRCDRGCANCALARITADANGDEWMGCDNQPLGLFAVLSQLNAVVA